jgi:hypothetical protein
LLAPFALPLPSFSGLEGFSKLWLDPEEKQGKEGAAGQQEGAGSEPAAAGR